VQPPWAECDDDMRRSCINGVVLVGSNPQLTAEELHEAWMKERLEAGWTFGWTKDPEKKLHPSLRPYAMLPASVRLKDDVFRAIVGAFRKKQEQERK